jgi:hypothetical protein
MAGGGTLVGGLPPLSWIAFKGGPDLLGGEECYNQLLLLKAGSYPNEGFILLQLVTLIGGEECYNQLVLLKAGSYPNEGSILLLVVTLIGGEEMLQSASFVECRKLSK